jgi:hypothetical protein
MLSDGTEFRPVVFKHTSYTIRVGEPGTDRVRIPRSVPSLRADEAKTMEVSL